MKYTIHGLSQSKLIEAGLDNDDALILSVIKDMYSSKNMQFQIIDGERFIWIDQGYLFSQIPIIGSQRKLQRKLKALCDENYLERRLLFEKDSVKGKFSYINITKKLDLLSEYLPYDKMSQGLRQSGIRVTTECRNKDSSIRDTNNIIYSRIIEYLNSKTGKSYKSTTRKTQSLIKARIDDGFNEEEFFKVIDSKVSEWKGTEYEKYLRPETLFGNKFEGYLNQDFGSGKKEISKGNLNIKKGNFDY
ncbi:conserved phage C-terminal domain-containing protein [Clostridium perfringens]|uniref:conserved phage C-terminal domain-containing protein n=1 Tax=Clostridium perfringens TaxID=1502 RepID=UPI0028E15CC9|nr:conserved phage C-terminal domain-containing protein [Clostridium perfringens]MDT9335867.1 conserved phage C-terminal domain-containing protein [Clostridium perfringens]MDT9343624.1 conserved phage C-terminal domain-containing protein [Clostridium perfringens]MDT9346805.1 conserved phage C-terminal domain-containing protein [Clostridium perfringens]MDT9352710.1 conserved phage C-terminal domain-containing protein [Clostridium perfringens]